MRGLRVYTAGEFYAPGRPLIIEEQHEIPLLRNKGRGYDESLKTVLPGTEADFLRDGIPRADQLRLAYTGPGKEVVTSKVDNASQPNPDRSLDESANW